MPPEQVVQMLAAHVPSVQQFRHRDERLVFASHSIDLVDLVISQDIVCIVGDRRKLIAGCGQ